MSSRNVAARRIPAYNAARPRGDFKPPVAPVHFGHAVAKYGQFEMPQITNYLRRKFKDVLGMSEALFEMFSWNAREFLALASDSGWATHELWTSHDDATLETAVLLVVKYYDSIDHDTLMSGGHAVLYFNDVGADREGMFVFRLAPESTVTQARGRKTETLRADRGWQVVAGPAVARGRAPQRVFIPEDARPAALATLVIAAARAGTTLDADITYPLE